MINCISPAEMAYFLELLSDIVTVFGTAGYTIIIHAEQGDVMWERRGESFCRTIPVNS